jgi:hypothetical protein
MTRHWRRQRVPRMDERMDEGMDERMDEGMDHLQWMPLVEEDQKLTG